MSVKMKTNAKLNLTLNIVGMYDNKFHSLSSVVTSIDICDIVTITARKDKKVIVTVNGEIDEGNTAFKVANAVVERFNTDGVDIIVEKHVAAGGGMGGSSVDAAASLCGMRRLFGLNMNEQMLEIASEFGSDIAYMIRGGLGVATGKGDNIMFVGSGKKFYFVVFTGERMSTKEVFAEYDRQPDYTRYDNDALLAALARGDIMEARKLMGNNLQPAAFRLSPKLSKIVETCAKCGLPQPVLTGSGGNMFLLCRDIKEAQRFAAKMNANGIESTVCASIDSGTEILEISK